MTLEGKILEVNKLLDDLGLTEMPFSTENGAMVFFPKKVFKKPPKSINHGNFWKIKIAKKTSNFWYQYLLFFQMLFCF